MDRVQTISCTDAIFKERCCRLSYGVLCLDEYNPNNPTHVGQKVTMDPRDGKKWVENQIDWFVKQVSQYGLVFIPFLTNSGICKGENVSTDGVLKPYVMKIKPGKEDRLWQTHVVMSTMPSDQLPSSLNQDGVSRLCDVESVLKDKGVDMKLKNRHWYNRGEKYLRAKFDIKVILGAADLKFQLQSKTKNILSKDHDAIQVKWELPRRNLGEDEDNLAAPYKAT